METVLIFLFFLAFLIRTVRNTFYQVFLWQIKEYRFDRMMAHLKTWQGKKMVFGLVSLVKFALIGEYLLGWPVFGLVVFVYLTEAIWELREFRVFGWKRPVWTLKTMVVVAGGILGSLGGLGVLGVWANWANLNNLAAGLLFLDKFLAPGISFLILILNILTIIQRSFIINKAKKMIKGRPDLMTIGVTGSYGKTSTKEFLSQILSSKFKVLKTKDSQNTAIGVAQTIIKELKDQKVLVAEMGAYKIGEIREICQICQPKIGIITGINEQHLDLFGSLKKTVEAKYELIEALPKDGLAVFNGKNQYCLEMAQKARTIGGIGGIRVIGKDLEAKEVKIFSDKLEFKVFQGLKFQKMSANLFGKQNLENILGAIAVAQYLGMSLVKISEAVAKLEAPERTMRAVRGLRNVGDLGSLIDDTFNANSDGVLAAIEYMKTYKGKKILVLTPMIELGEAAGTAHQKVGQLAGKVCDLVILTNKNYYEDFKRGFEGNEGVGERIWVGQGKEAAGKIKAILDEDGIAVFEGKETAKILKQVQDDAKK